MKVRSIIQSSWLLTGLLLITSCSTSGSKTKTISTKETQVEEKIQTPAFNKDSAFVYVEKQVAFGPRVPNTDAHAKCADHLASELKRFGADVIVQEADVTAFDNTILRAKNIIGQFNPEMNNRVLLFAHWDSRPFADYDKDPSKHNDPIDGANDGGSGVGVLLEIARQIGISGINFGVDIIFFDAEDYGQPAHINLPHKANTWCLGSQYWAQNPHKKNYYARYGILLDMVGAKNALFYKEQHSMQFAPRLTKRIWKTADKLGYGSHFINDYGGLITDDHVYVNKYLNIPCVDIIQFDPNSRTSFGSFWHTHDDTMDNIDRNTLKAVGQTVIEVIYNEK